MKKIALLLAILLIAIQFIRLDKNESGYESLAAFEQETQMPAEVKNIMQNNCYDCHSGQTNYPWYAEIVPVSLWLDHHIEEGREHLDFTQWASWEFKKKDHKLEECIEEVEKNAMPIQSYTWMHGNLSAEEKELLITWAKTARNALSADR